MLYIVLILVQTVVMPIVSGVIHLSVTGQNPLIVFGIWFGFWGVGTRLVFAGFSQLTNPTRTTEGILGLADTNANQVVQELGFANLSLGVVALATPFLPPSWAIIAAIPGAIYLGLAGIRHLVKSGKGAKEHVATWTDLVVFLGVAGGVTGVILAGA